MKPTTNISALVRLLDDPDEGIYHQIKSELITLGSEAIPALEHHWEHESFGALFQERIESIVHCIQLQSLEDKLLNWKERGADDLFEGALLLATYQYPDLDEIKVKEQLDLIVRDVWLELHDDLTAFEKVRILNHIFFEEYNFTGNTTNYHAPGNSFLNDVLESRKGNPISMAVLYMAIARRVDLPVFGVNLPRHFILAFANNRFTGNIPRTPEEILFYINPFSRGTLFHDGEIDQFLDQLNLPQKPEFYVPCDNIAIINRILNNLIFSYDKLGATEKVNELKNLQISFNE